MNTLEDKLYDLNDQWNDIYENEDIASMGEEWKKKFEHVGRLITELCIESDVINGEFVGICGK